MCKVMRLFVKSILSVFFFHFCSIFRQKPRPSSRFLPFQAVSFETICTSPACAKVAQPLSRRPATLTQICRRHPPSSPPHPPSSLPYPPSFLPHPPSSLPIVFHFFATSSVFFADSLPLLRRFIRLDRHILHLAAVTIHLLRRSGCLARHSDPPVRHRANLARYQLYVDFRA